MKKLVAIIILILFIALCANVFAQKPSYPFTVKVSGKGARSIVFIPGLGCSGDVWNETVALFEKDHTCYVLTMAGFAGVPPQTGASFTNWEKGIAAYLHDNKISKSIIVGHSLGGGLAMALAADHPDLAAKVVVVDALPCLAALSNATFKAKENNDCSGMVAKYSAIPDAQFYQMQKQSMPQLLADSTKLEQAVNWSVKSDRATFAGMYCDFSNTDLREKIANVSCPSLILLESYFVNFKDAISTQYQKMKGANLHYATKGLHFIMYDDKAWFETQLKDFINR